MSYRCFVKDARNRTAPVVGESRATGKPGECAESWVGEWHRTSDAGHPNYLPCGQRRIVSRSATALGRTAVDARLRLHRKRRKAFICTDNTPPTQQHPERTTPPTSQTGRGKAERRITLDSRPRMTHEATQKRRAQNRKSQGLCRTNAGRGGGVRSVLRDRGQTSRGSHQEVL